MDFAFSPAAEDLRGRLRTLIDEHVPRPFLGAFSDDPADLDTANAFCRRLADERLLTMAWPPEYGGQGASVWEQTVVREEMWAHHEPRGAQYMGLNWVGPVLMRHGTDAQRAEHLPRIAEGEVIWCQGFSEPEAGSDLGSLRTRAEPDGSGRWVINGQKVWTSYATMAQWCFLLARTSRGARNTDGITVFLLPMSTPGIQVRPIPAMVGPHHLNEVFLDDVLIGPESVLGEVDRGWTVVREVLAFERVGIARYARCERLLQWAPTALGTDWDGLPPELLTRWSKALIRTRSVRLMAYRVIEAQSQGRADPVDTAAYRVAASLLDQEVAQLLMDLTGPEVLTASSYTGRTGSEIDDRTRFVRAVEDHWRYAQAATVASGTLEMQRNLIGKGLARSG